MRLRARGARTERLGAFRLTRRTRIPGMFGVAGKKSKAAFLQQYGIVIVKRSQTSEFTMDFKIEDVKIE